jgi:hypothetical protein
MRRAIQLKIAGSFAVMAILIGGDWPAVAQRLYEEVEPQLFRGRISDASLGVYTEGVFEKADYQSGISSTYRRFFIGPLIGLAVDGSIYHPNLFQYNISGDGAVGWTQERTTTSGGPTVDRSELDHLGNFNGNAIILANQPYRSSLFASSGHTFHEYDFFNRVLVDTLRFGLNTGYAEGPLPVHLSVMHLDENTSGVDFESKLQQTTVSLDVHNDRPSGKTVFTYNLDDFNRNSTTAQSSGIQNSVGLTDTEMFGSRKNIEWRNGAAYTERDFTDSPGKVWTAGSHLSIEHWTNLWSFYDADFLHDQTDPTVTENYDGSAAVRHQLFASLTSGLRFQAIRYTSEQPGSDFESTQFIGTWSEGYSKRLSDSARLSLGGALGFSHTDQSSSSTIQVIGEQHTFGANGAFANSFFLNNVNVDQATIELFDQARTIRYTENVDYTVSVLGAQTLLLLIQPNPSGLTPTTPVVADYQAAPQGSGVIHGRLEAAQIRLDLFQDLLGIYARYNNDHYSAPTNIIVQDVSAVAFGTDVNWKWLRAGAEYEIYDSTFSSYNSLRLFQTCSFQLDEVSTLSLNLAEQWTDYKSDNKNERFYSAIGRYHRGLTRHLRIDVEAGVTDQRGSVANQFLAAFRPGFTYNIGKLSVKAGYDFEYVKAQDTQESERHMFFFRAQRAF